MMQVPGKASSPRPFEQGPAVIFRTDGHKQKGKFVSLDTGKEQVTIENEQDSQREVVSFTDLLMLEVMVDSSLGLIQDGYTQKASVTFIDGHQLNANVFNLASDKHGIYWLQQGTKQKFRQIFVPHSSIKECDFSFKAVKGDTDRGTTMKHKKPSSDISDINKNIAHSSQELSALLKVKMLTNSRELGEMLLERKIITADQLLNALDIQERIKGNKRIGQIIEEYGMADAALIHAALAMKFGMPFVKLQYFDIDLDVLEYIPEEVAYKYGIIPLMMFEGQLVVAVEDPGDSEVLDMARFRSGKRIEPVLALRDDIEWAINNYYGIGENLELAQLEKSLVQDVVKNADIDDEYLGKKGPIVRVVNNIILDAIRRKVSDVHIRPTEEDTELLYRIDGSLVPIKNFSKTLLPALISRIKIVGQMDVAEHRLPQDGRARAVGKDAVVDLRISVIPTISGESAVIRLLNTAEGLKAVAELGFNAHDEQLFVDLLHRNNGIFLVTGPTGSGKSTTLYAALGEVKRQNVNIITVEDPVEYHVEGVEQIQVNSAINFTFASALRNILRHDPDVIMVGEIRDRETGKIAVESALTGHLVLSTLHTNDAASAITRLMEMGIEPYLLSSSILGVLAQRLMRRNCKYCIEPEEVEASVRRFLNVADDEVFYKGQGCEHCNNTGYSGRFAAYELLVVTEGLRAMITPGVTVDQIRNKALLDGMSSLTENALQHARQRKTSLAEVYRVRLE